MPDSPAPERRVVEMKFQSADEGSLRYEPTLLRRRAPAWLAHLFGVALGVVVFLMIAAIFLTVVVPVVLLLAAWTLIRRVFFSPPDRNPL